MPLSDDVIIGTIAACSAVVSPVLLSILNNRYRAKERQVDFERQEAVATRVAAVARQASDDAKSLRKRTDEVAAVAAESSAELIKTNKAAAEATNAQLHDLHVGQREIHALVNSNLTTEMQAHQAALVSTLGLMQEVVALQRRNGIEPSADTLTAMENTRLKIAELDAILKDRIQVTQAVAAASFPSVP
jgi:hypothetical protein